MSTPNSTVPESDSRLYCYVFRHNLYFIDTGCAFFVFFFRCLLIQTYIDYKTYQIMRLLMY